MTRDELDQYLKHIGNGYRLISIPKNAYSLLYTGDILVERIWNKTLNCDLVLDGAWRDYAIVQDEKIAELEASLESLREPVGGPEYKQARGIFADSDEPAEVSIRRLRDASTTLDQIKQEHQRRLDNGEFEDAESLANRWHNPDIDMSDDELKKTIDEIRSEWEPE